MNYEAIRDLLAHSPETRFAEVVIGNPNEIWSELRGLMAERDRAVELLREIANSNGFTRGQINDSRPMILAPCVFDLDSEGVERLIKFFRALEGKQ